MGLKYSLSLLLFQEGVFGDGPALGNIMVAQAVCCYATLYVSDVMNAGPIGCPNYGRRTGLRQEVLIHTMIL